MIFKLALVLGLSAVPSFAARRVTVGQLEQVLVAAAGRPDASVAHQLADLELSERLSASAFQQWQARLPGPEARQALLVLADLSAFLDITPGEIPARPKPDLGAQREMIALAAKYAKKTISKLPDFFATQSTVRFEDTPRIFQHSIAAPYQPVHAIGRTTDTVFYRDGREVVDPGAPASKQGRPGAGKGLTTAGVFGPMLGTVLVDVAHGTLMWGGWEPGPAGTVVAVFRYVILTKDSHYEVNLSGVFQQNSGYHGTFAVDPANGTILRLTVQADLKPEDPILRSDVLVEYGPVEIAGKTYVCPLRSVSIWIAPPAFNGPRVLRGGVFDASSQLDHSYVRTSLTDVAFENYHVFRADVRVMTADNKDLPADPLAPAARDASGQNRAVPSLQAVETREETSKARETSGRSAAAVEAPPVLQSNPPPGMPEIAPASRNLPVMLPELPTVAVAESRVTAATVPVPSPAEPAVPTLRVNSRLVYVDAVVHDRAGHIVTGLTRDDFRILEDGAPQKIDSFRAVGEDLPGSGERSSTGMSPAPARNSNVPPASAAIDTVNMILFDLLDTSPVNQAYARKQMLKFLEGLPPGHQIALFVLDGRQLHTVQSFTGDSALLARAALLLQSASSGLFQSANAQRQSNDVTGAVPGLPTPGGADNGIAQDLAAQLATENFQHGQVREEVVRGAFRALAQATARFSGRKNLFWLAENFPITAITGMDVGSRIAVYPISVLGLEGDNISAEMNGNGVTSGGAGVAGAPVLGSQMDERSGSRAELREQLERIATQTGGAAFSGTNDLTGALRKALEYGDNYYSLAYSPTDKNWNGRFRRIELKMAHPGYSLSYRRGYVARPEGPGAPGGN